MASTDGSMGAVGAPWVDCRGGRGGGCPLYLASRRVATAPCADDVIFTCRNVSGGANEYVVTIHEGDEVIAHQQSGSRYICLCSRCFLARLQVCDNGGAVRGGQGAGRVDSTCEMSEECRYTYTANVSSLSHTLLSRTFRLCRPQKSHCLALGIVTRPSFTRTSPLAKCYPHKGPHLTCVDHSLPQWARCTQELDGGLEKEHVPTLVAIPRKSQSRASLGNKSLRNTSLICMEREASSSLNGREGVTCPLLQHGSGSKRAARGIGGV
jgi:hypothetical protein